MTLQETKDKITQIDYKLMQIHKGKEKISHKNEYDNLITFRKNLYEIKQMLEKVVEAELASLETPEDYGL